MTLARRQQTFAQTHGREAFETRQSKVRPPAPGEHGRSSEGGHSDGRRPPTRRHDPAAEVPDVELYHPHSWWTK